MTDTAAGRDAFRRAILADPHDDTARLVYADWLDETGDPADAALAEFIRLGVLADPPFDASGCESVSARWCPTCGDCVCPNPEGGLDCDACPLHARYSRHAGCRNLERRLAELEAVHGPRWAKAPCPPCGGAGAGVVSGDRLSRSGTYRVPTSSPCPACGGTGDLFVESRPTYVGGPDPRHEPRDVAFARGFPDAVKCRLAEALRGGHVVFPRPTAWALAVVTVHPVTRFVVTDIAPAEHDGRDLGPHAGGRSHDWWATSSGCPPAVVAEVAADPRGWPDGGRGYPRPMYVEFPTREAADDALALAVGRLVRRAARERGLP